MKPNKAKSLYGLVLGGGLSSRMGKDKALIKYHGEPQKDHVFKLLEKFCDRVYFSANTQSIADNHTIKDAYPFQGPLNGILSAFKFQSDVAWLTVPIDMPLVDESIIQFLMDHRDVTKVATCFYDADDKLPEPLLTVWEPHSADLLKAFYEEGKFSPREFLRISNIQLLKVPDKKALKNVNTPNDLNEFLEQK